MFAMRGESAVSIRDVQRALVLGSLIYTTTRSHASL